MDFLSPIISPIVENLMIPVKKHVGFWVSSTKYVKDMDAGMERLKEQEQEVKDAWKMARANTEVVPKSVEPWLKDIEELLKEREASIPKDPIGCFNVLKRHNAGERSFKFLEEIKKLKTRGSEIKFTKDKLSLAMVPPTSTQSSTFSLVSKGTRNNFRSRELIYNEALKSLNPKDNDQKIIALCGIGGIGKTTMMEQLESDVRDSNMFQWVVKVHVGKNRNLISLQGAISEGISKRLTEEDQDARAERLREKFHGMSNEGKNNVLVIMDNLWEKVDLKDVGITNPFPDGFKLLLTSRFVTVCNAMAVDSVFDVGFLNDTEAKDLFFEVIRSKGDDHKLRKIGEAIVMRCGGFPIAIKTIAEKLRGAIKEEWEFTLSRLKENDLTDLKSITDTIFQMSYDNVKDDIDKAIFLLSGLFPNDFDIRTEDLLRYGWGLSLFKDFKTVAKARSQMKRSVSNLIHANLLTKSDVNGCVKMHDLVRAFVLSNFSNVKQAIIDNMFGDELTKDANESYDRISINCTSLFEFPADFNQPNLSLLVLRDCHTLFKFPEDMFRKLEKLKVVSFEKANIPFSPVILEHSVNLRTLYLSSCVLEHDDLSFLGDLSNLEILSFVGCDLKKLPSTIGRLSKLKLLDVTRCNLCVDDDVFQNLKSLEELYMRASSHGVTKDANCDGFEKLSSRLTALELDFLEDKAQPEKVSFEKLEKFKISIGGELDFDEMYSSRNTLKFVVGRNELLEYKISKLLEEVENLELQVNDMYHIGEIAMNQSFSSLRVLHVSNCADLTCLFTAAMANDLIELERLSVSYCPVLTSLVDDDSSISEIKFQKLKFMSLKGLPNMLQLSENVLNLPEMMELILADLPNFTSIYPSDKNNTLEMRSLLNEKVVILNLEKLHIYGMENLKQIWPSHISTTEQNSASMLREIKVSDCHSLVNLFPSNPLPLLNNLEYLKVEKCGSIEVLFDIDIRSVSGIGEDNSSRLRRIYVEDLDKLKDLWRMRCVNDSKTLISAFKRVESIKINSCMRFTNIFTPTTINFDLGALTEYIVFSAGKEIDGNFEGEISEVGDYISNVTYPSYFLRTCHHLELLKLSFDERVEEAVFEMGGQSPLLLPSLQTISLFHLGMGHVWKGNRNKILHKPFPFQNLTNIHLKKCPMIKYLLSPHMTVYLSNMKSVYIEHCYGMEEVISSRDDKNEENITSHQAVGLFPRLVTLTLHSVPRLKSIDSGDARSTSDKISSNIIHHPFQSGQVMNVAYWSLCQYPRKMKIFECDALSSLVPWYAAGQMKRLEELTVTDCKTMTEVFESDSINNNTADNADEENTHGTTLTRSPLNNITTVVAPQLSNLVSVYLSDCDLLSHIFTFSTLESLKQLRELKVKRCNAIQVIIREENIGTLSKVVVFPRLETLKLKELPNINAFFAGTNDFQWPLLENLSIKNCPQVMMVTAGHLKAPKLKYIRTEFGKYSVECDQNFPGTINQITLFPTSSSDPTISKAMHWSPFQNLIKCKVIDQDVGRSSVIPSHGLLHLQKFEKINMYGCEDVEEVFEVVASDAEENNSGFHESQTLVQVPNLREMKLEALDDLKYLWKSNQWMTLEFPNLTTLSIVKCNSLEHAFTCSMVGSLEQLQVLEICNCESIEVIVKENEDEDDEEEEGEEEEEDGDEDKECDGKMNEIITLPRLKSLVLDTLPSFKGFCLGKKDFSFLALDRLEVMECPAITGFTKGHLSTPVLEKINTYFGRYSLTEDLNSFIKTKQEEGKEF